MTTVATRSAEIAWETGLFSCPAAGSITLTTSTAVAQSMSAAMSAATASGATASGEVATGEGRAVTVDDRVVEARTAYERVSARAAYQWALHGRAVIVDIRPAALRAVEGEVHPALRPVVIERNGLEGLLDPTSEARLEWVTPDTRVVVICQAGDGSSLVAATLRRIGLRNATDVIGGLYAWREAGLPLAGVR